MMQPKCLSGKDNLFWILSFCPTNEENETPFEPNLDMTLYVESKPEVTLAAENPKGFYEENQNVTISCDVVSYPINITRYSITHSMKIT